MDKLMTGYGRLASKVKRMKEDAANLPGTFLSKEI